VSLCQATLSIGPYLLLKVQFQHHNCSPDVPGLEPENERLDQQDVGTELPLSITAERRSSHKLSFRCMEFSETQSVTLLMLGNPIYRGSIRCSGLGLHTRVSSKRGSRKLSIAPVLMARPVLLYPSPPLYSLL
jgi:hypothetical protein